MDTIQNNDAMVTPCAAPTQSDLELLHSDIIRNMQLRYCVHTVILREGEGHEVLGCGLG